jgi:hypothetical protein
MYQSLLLIYLHIYDSRLNSNVAFAYVIVEFEFDWVGYFTAIHKIQICGSITVPW